MHILSAVNPSETMATGLDRLEKNFDKLEKFFSRTKKAAASRESLFSGIRSGTPLPSMQTDSAAKSQTFPYPSFIRPTSTRMLARDETVVTPHPTRRAQSLPEASDLPHHIFASRPTSPINQPPQVPARTSSLLHRRRSSLHRRTNASIAGLLEFSFAEKSTPDLGHSLSSSSSTASPLSSPVQKRSLDTPQDLSRAFIPARPDTPPPSDQEECSSPFSQRLVRACPKMSTRACPTPELSPTLLPLAEESGGDEESENVLEEMSCQKHMSLGEPQTSRMDVTPIPKSLSDSALLPLTPLSLPSPVLKEPSFGEFFSLSDDDIADDYPQARPPSQPPSCGLPPNPPSPASPTPKPSCYPLLTLSSPLTSRPATAAAFETARIAARYKFDLVYVVNLWPKNLGSAQYKAYEPAITARLTATGDGLDGQGNLDCVSPKSGMTGRLLAGYGLPSVMSPFRISAPVHQKVLRTSAWLEYRSEHGALDEFSRGYSCSFYTGVGLQGATTAKSSESQTTTKPKRRSQPNNRGIVFAAYRLPRLDGTTHDSDLPELEALHRDAETLVEMLIDIHSKQRARHPMSRHDIDETGPMPTRGRLPSLTI